MLLIRSAHLNLRLERALFDDPLEVVALQLPLELGHLHDEVVHLTGLGIDVEDLVPVEVRYVLDDVMYHRGFQEHTVNIPIIEQNAHSVDLVTEHIPARVPRFPDKGSRELHVGREVYSF